MTKVLLKYIKHIGVVASLVILLWISLSSIDVKAQQADRFCTNTAFNLQPRFAKDGICVPNATVRIVYPSSETRILRVGDSIVYNFGNGVVATANVITNGVLPTTGLGAGIVAGVYPNILHRFANDPYHAYTYTNSNGATDCFYKIRVTGERKCLNSDLTVIRDSEYTVWETESANLNGISIDQRYEICEGAEFDFTFANTTIFNCNLNSLGAQQNGKTNSLTNLDSEHRELEWKFDFTAFSLADRNLIRLVHPLGTNIDNTPYPALDTVVGNSNIYTIEQSVAASSHSANIRLVVPPSITATNPGKTFSVSLELRNYCNRGEGIANTSAKIRTFTYQISSSPSKPTVSSNNIIVCQNDTPAINVTNSTGYVRIYKAFGNNPTSLATGSDFIENNQNPIASRTNNFTPTGISAPGTYTFYVTGTQMSGNLECESEATIVTITRLGSVGNNPGAITVNHNIGCVFSNKTFSLPAAPSDQTLGGTTYQTEYVWTVPLNYIPTLNYDADNTNNLTSFNSTATEHSYNVRTASITFRINNPAGSNNGYVSDKTIRVVTRFVRVAGVPSCVSNASSVTLSEVKPAATLSRNSTVCYAGTLLVTLSNYQPNRMYDILVRDQNGGLYNRNNIVLTGTSQAIVITQTATTSPIINGANNITLVRMVDRTALTAQNATGGCPNDNQNAQPTPPIGANFPGAASVTIMPILLDTNAIGVTSSTVCPGEDVTITVPPPPNIVGGRTTRLRYSGFPNLTLKSQTLSTITFTANLRAGIGSSQGRIWRELTTRVGSNNCPSSAFTYTVNVRELPVVKINTESKTICFQGVANVTINSFAGVAPTTGIFEATLTNGTVQNVLSNLQQPPVGSPALTRTIPTATLAPGNYNYTVRGVSEQGQCNYDNAPIFDSSGNLIDTGTYSLTVRENLDMGSATSIRITQGGRTVPTTESVCTGQTLTLEAIDNTNAVVVPASTAIGGNTVYEWTLPATWARGAATADGSSITVTVPSTAQVATNISVVRRYDTMPNCVTSASLVRSVAVVPGPQAATITGPDTVNVCMAVGSTRVAVVGNAPSATEAGLWTIVSPAVVPAGVSVANPSSSNTELVTPSSGSFVLRWSLTRNGAGCGANTDDVTINVQSAVFTSYNAATLAGPNLEVCATNATDVLQPLQMNATLPSVALGHSGVWAIVSYTDLDGAVVPNPSGSFVDNTKNDTTYVLNQATRQYGTYVFRWTISATACGGAGTSVEGDVTYTVNPRTEIELMTMTQGGNAIVVNNTTMPPSAIICVTNAGLATAALQLSSAITGIGAGTTSTLAWTASVNQAGVGAPVNTDAGAGSTQRKNTTVTYTPRTVDFGTTITFTLTSQTSSTPPNTCVSNSTRSLAVRFVRKLEINNVNRDIIVCNNDPLNLTFANDTNSNVGVVYNWRVNMVGARFNPTFPSPFNSPNAIAEVSGQGHFSSFRVNNTQNTAYRARIRVTATQNGCESESEEFFVTIMPAFSLTPTQTSGRVCSGDPYTISTTLAEYSDIRNNTNGRIPIHVRYTIEDLDTTQNGVFQNPLVGTPNRENLVGTVNLLNFTSAAALPTSQVSSLTIPAANLTLANTISTPRQVEITMFVYAENPNGAGQCNATQLTHTLTVNPKPILQPVPARDVQVCSGTPFTLAPPSQMTAGNVRYRWTIGAIVRGDADDGVNGQAANNVPQVNITQTITTSPGADGSQSYVRVPYIITPVTTSALGSCDGDPVTINVIVLPQPILTAFPANTIICSGDELGLDVTNTNIDPLVPTATTYTAVAVTGPAPQFFSANATPQGTEDFRMALTSLPTSNNDVVNAIIRITPTVSYTLAGETYTCTSSAVDYTVRIAPVVAITNLATVNNPAICDSGAFNYAPTHNVPFTSGTVDYTWTIRTATAGVNVADFTVNGNPPVAGATSFSGEGTAIADAIQFNAPLANPIVLQYVITPRFHKVAAPTGPGDYCPGTASTVINLTVNTTPRIVNDNPAPAATPIPNAFSVCSGVTVTLGKTVANNSPAPQQNFGINPNTASISWVVANTGANITGVADGDNGIGEFNGRAFNTGTTLQSYQVTFTPFVGLNPNRCDGPAVIKTISVSPGPVLTTLNNTTVCSLTPNEDPALAATANNISFTSSVTPSIAGTTFNYSVTYYDVTNNKITTGVQTYNSAGTLITLNNAVNVPHFNQATTNAGGALTTTVGGGNLTDLNLKVRNNTNNDINMVIIFRSEQPGVACRGPQNILTYTINPAPSINNITTLQGMAPNQYNYELCSNNLFTFTPASIMQGVVRYKFNAVTPLPTGVSGVPTTEVVVSGGAITNLSFTPLHSKATAQIIVINAVAEVDGCDGDVQLIRIKIDPTPTVALAPATSALVLNNTINICYGENLDLAVIGTVENSSFDWSVNAVAGLSALNATNNAVNYTRAGNTPLTDANVPATPTLILNSANQRLVNSTTVPLELIYTITPRVAGGGTACSGVPVNVSVTVHPRPAITNVPGAATTICSGDNYTFDPTFNVAGASATWQIVSNDAAQPGDISIRQGATTFTVSNVIMPVMPVAGSPVPAITPANPADVMNTNGSLNVSISNLGGLPANVVFEFTPTLEKSPGNPCPNTDNRELVTVTVQPNGPRPGTNLVRAVSHNDAFTLNPGVGGGTGLVNVQNATFDWTANVPVGVELRSAANSTIVAANNTSDGINLSRVTNLTNAVQDVTFTIRTNLPISTCTTNNINLVLHVLPRLVTIITPNANTVCFDNTIGIDITNNIINANTPNLTLIYNWTATNIGPNLRESGAPPVAVVTAGNNVALADINTLEQKRLTILNPVTNTANESVTYTVTATLTYSYTDQAGMPANQTISSGQAVSVVTVVPQPVSSLFQIRDNTTGNYSDAGTNVNATTQTLNDLCTGQAFTLFVDPAEGNTGTPGSTYVITLMTDAAPAGVIYGVPTFTPFDNAVFIQMPVADIWNGQIQVVETNNNGCVGEAKILQFRMSGRPVAHAGEDITVCEGESVVLGRQAGAGANQGHVATTGDGATLLPGATYNWQPNVFLTPPTAVPAPPAPNNFSIARPTITPTRTTTYRLVVTSANGCDSVVKTVTVTVIPKPNRPVISFTTGGVQTCVGGAVTIEATADASTTNIEWWFNAVNDPTTANRLMSAGRTDVTVSGAINQTLNFNAISANGFYFAKAIGNNNNPSVANCDSDLSSPVQINFITPHAMPTLAVSSNGVANQNFLCSTGAENVVINATVSTITPANTASTTYEWERKATATAVATPVNATTSDELTLSTAGDSGFYRVRAINSSCNGPYSEFVEVIILPEMSTPFITSTTGATGVCNNSSITLVANLSELTNGTVTLAELEFEWSFTRATAANSSVLTETGQQLVINNAVANVNNGTYRVRIKRNATVGQNGFGRLAGNVVSCFSTPSRDFVVQVVSIPPTPLVTSTSTSPFCGDNGITREFILSLAHPQSGATPPQSYNTNVLFKWERKPTATGAWTEVARLGTLRYALTQAAQSGFYRVSAVNTENGANCESPPVEFADEVVIRDSPFPPNFSGVSLDVCETTTTATTNLAITSGTAPYTLDIQVYVPDANDPTDATKGSRSVRTLTNVNNGDAINLLNPDATTPVPLVNNSSNISVITYTFIRLVDANNCQPSSFGRPFELRLQPTPGARNIDAPVPNVTTANAAQAIISDVPDTSTPPNMIRTAFVCAGTTSRFEVPSVSNTSYTWAMLPANNLTVAGQFSLINGGGTIDNFVEIAFDNVATPNLVIQVTVANRTTGCAAIRTLPITLLGQTRAFAGSDQSICPESKRQIPGTPPIDITYTRKNYVTLGGTTANPTGSALNTIPTSGTLTYLWRKVQTGVPRKAVYDVNTDLASVPVSDFEMGSNETMSNPRVSPLVTSTYVVLVGDANSNCTPSQDAVEIIVLDPPVITITNSKVDICITQTTPVNLAPLVTGALPTGATAGTDTPVFTFSCDNCDDPNTVRKNGNDWIFDPTIARQFSDPTKNYGVFNIVVSYQDNRGCSQFNLGGLNIEIFQQPVLTIDDIADVCDTGAIIDLEGKVDGNIIDYTSVTANTTATNSQGLAPLQYAFTGPGVSYDATKQRFVFNPAVAMSSYNFGQARQAHTIKFLYKDRLGCYSNDLSKEIVVKPSPTISVPLVGTTGTRYDFGICEGAGGTNGYQLSEGRIDMGTGGGAVPFTTAQLPGVTYSGTGVTPNAASPGAFFFNASVAGVGSHTITLQFEEQGVATPCTSTITYNVTVHSQPVVQFPDFNNLGSCAALFNLTTATVQPDLSAVKNLPFEAEGVYRDVSQLPIGYVDKDANGNITPGAAAVIRELDDSTPPKVVSYQFDPSRVSAGYHRLRYDYKDGFGCENVKPTPIAQILIIPPPTPILTPKDPKDTNPTFSSRKPFSTVCPNDSPFEITAWGSIPATGNTSRYETEDTRLRALITTRTGTGGTTHYWFNPAELKSIASNIIDITAPFSVKVKYVVTDTNGCEGFDTQPLSITPIPTGSIGLNNDECNGGPLSFSFNANAIAPFKLTYIDDSNTPYLVENVPHVHKISVKPNKITTYRIQKIEDRNGCINLTPVNTQATVAATPVADFTPNPLILTDPNKSVAFENTSNELTWNFKWNFGDGNEIQGKQSDGNINITHADGSTTSGTYVKPVHNYKSYGEYRIRLTASERTCVDTIFKDINIQPEVPNVDFTASILSGCAPLTVNFTNTSKFVDANSLVWNFGDGAGISRKENPRYIFNKPGLYKISLTGTNQTGSVITKEKPDYIEVKGNPDARFSLKPNIVHIPNEAVKFSNLSVDADEYAWDFGDGTTSAEENPSHTYKSAGTFKVTLNVKNTTTQCTDKFEQEGAVTAIAGGNVRVPNVFTPNLNSQSGPELGNTNTGEAPFDPLSSSTNNNIFAPQVDGAIDYTLQVFDAWGNLLFHTNSQFIGWNGYYKGELLPIGAYVYKLKITFANGIFSERAGDITLIR